MAPRTLHPRRGNNINKTWESEIDANLNDSDIIKAPCCLAGELHSTNMTFKDWAGVFEVQQKLEPSPMVTTGSSVAPPTASIPMARLFSRLSALVVTPSARTPTTTQRTSLLSISDPSWPLHLSAWLVTSSMRTSHPATTIRTTSMTTPRNFMPSHTLDVGPIRPTLLNLIFQKALLTFMGKGTAFILVSSTLSPKLVFVCSWTWILWCPFCHQHHIFHIKMEGDNTTTCAINDPPIGKLLRMGEDRYQ